MFLKPPEGPIRRYPSNVKLRATTADRKCSPGSMLHLSFQPSQPASVLGNRTVILSNRLGFGQNRVANLDRTWIPRFLSETSVRIFLQSLFVAIVNSGENCSLLVNEAPGEITWEKTRGSPLARKCMLGAARWLAVA